MRKARKHARVKSKEAAGQPKAQPIAAQTGAEGQPSRNERFPIVGIGASAGGLEAFTQLLKHLPADTGMGFVLVQHLDRSEEHTSELQSPCNLVCRLLLEKKKKQNIIH